MNERIEFWRRVFAVYKPFRRVVLLSFGLLILGLGMSVTGPYIYGRLITALQSGGSLGQVFKIAALSLLFAFASGGLNSLRGRIELLKIDFSLRNHAEMMVLKKLMTLSIGQHRNQHSGITLSVISQGQGDITRLANLVLYNMIPDLARVAITMMALLLVGWQVGTVVLVSGLLLVWLSLQANSRFAPLVKKFQDKGHSARKILYEIVGHMPLVQTHAQEDHMSSELKTYQETWAQAGRQVFLRVNTWNFIRMSSLSFVNFLVVIVGAILFHRGEWQIGTMLTTIMWSNGAIGGLQNLLSYHKEIMQMTSSVKKYLAIMDIEPAVMPPRSPHRLPQIKGRIEFKDVTFEYPGDKSYIELDGEDGKAEDAPTFPALDRVSFVVEPGQSVAFVGSSGAGKSTIITLLLRGYDPTTGAIFVDGHDLRSLDLSEYRRQVGLVEQEVVLLDGSVGENITFGLNGEGKSVTPDELHEVARKTGIDRFYDRLPDSFDTVVGERGIKLSGGQRQRVGLARAMIKDPALLILDEATSHLDSVTEHAIQESLREVSHGRTTIVVAHRLSTVRHVDKIIVLEKGQIVGEGSHDELLQTCPEYQKLVEHQLLSDTVLAVS